MGLRDISVEKGWEALASHDPLWTSCTSGKRHVAWKLDEFLATGEHEVTWALEKAKAAKLYPARQLLAIDFGCGPGRLTGALAQSFQRVIGIDISPTMLRSAREVHEQESITFSGSTQDLEEGCADLIYSTFVLQHVPKASLESYILEFSRLLDANGLLVFQFPSKPKRTLVGITFKLIPSAIIDAIQRYVLRWPGGIPMNWMNPKDVSRVVEAAGFATCVDISGPTYSPNWEDVWYLCAK